MIRANKIRINKYKSENIIKLVGFYIRQKWTLTANNISTKMGNINGEIFKMNYINVNHLVWLYDEYKTPDTPIIHNNLLCLVASCYTSYKKIGHSRTLNIQKITENNDYFFRSVVPMLCSLDLAEMSKIPPIQL